MLCVVAGLGIAVLGHRGDGSAQAATSTSISTPTTVDASAPGVVTSDQTDPSSTDTPTTDDTTTTTTTTTTPPDPEQVAAAQLAELTRTGLASTSLSGEWTAQLASKAVGITDERQTTASGSHTFMAVDILAEFSATQQRFSQYGDVRLLSSTDYGKRSTYQGKPIYVTLLFGAFGSRESVEAFCESQYPSITGASLQNVCLPRQVNPPS